MTVFVLPCYTKEKTRSYIEKKPASSWPLFSLRARNLNFFDIITIVIVGSVVQNQGQNQSQNQSQNRSLAGPSHSSRPFQTVLPATTTRIPNPNQPSSSVSYHHPLLSCPRTILEEPKLNPRFNLVDNSGTALRGPTDGAFVGPCFLFC